MIVLIWCIKEVVVNFFEGAYGATRVVAIAMLHLEAIVSLRTVTLDPAVALI